MLNIDDENGCVNISFQGFVGQI